jgi:phosphate:Na+ symporter
MIFGLLGGIALLLYGLHLTGKGLQDVAGGRLRQILGTVTRNRFLGVGIGAAITGILQSSSATTVMLVGFTSAGLITLRQTIAIILGADIGTTLTVQLIAFQVFDYSLLMIALGFALFFLGKQRKLRSSGLTILGFGFIFLALKTLSDSMIPLRESDLARDLLFQLSESPIWGVILAAILTAIMHSSAAVIGIALAFASQGLMPLSSAIPIILGANVGTCAMALVASMGGNTEAKRVAVAHTLFKVLGVLVVFPFMGLFEQGVVSISASVPRQIANAHTLFNIGITALFLPFATPLALLVTRMVPEQPDLNRKLRPKYLDPHVLDSPSIALGLATREALRMADVVQEMMKDTVKVFQENNQDLLEDIEKRDDWVDLLDREIKLYLTKLSSKSLSEDQSEREVALLALISDLENIGDIIDKNLMDIGKKKIYQGLKFSEQGLKEIVEFHGMVSRNFELALSAFASQDMELAQRVIQEKVSINHHERGLRQAHIERLHQGLRESIETSALHLDILTNLKRINHHVTSLAYPIVESV